MCSLELADGRGQHTRGARTWSPEPWGQDTRSPMPGRVTGSESSPPCPATADPTDDSPIKVLPLFRQSFLQPGGQARPVSYKEPQVRGPPARSLPRLPQTASKMASRPKSDGDMSALAVPVINLEGVEIVNGPPTETEVRRARLKMFELECSHSFGHMYLGGGRVAKSREVLRQHGITHVVNCVRFQHDDYFKDEIKYLGLYLQDWSQEDIYSVFYDVFDFVEAARESGGKVFVHCSQGVSRSATVTIAYIMWRTNRHVDDVLEELKGKRAVVEPNLGFYFQLLAWDNRRKAVAGKRNIYRIAPLSRFKPTSLVAKIVPNDKSAEEPRDLNCLDPRGAFVLHTSQKAFVWIGDQCPESFLRAARKFAAQLAKYENAPKAVEVRQGEETTEFASLLGSSGDPSSLAKERDDFTLDYERYHKSLVPQPAVGDEPRIPPLPAAKRGGRRSQSETIFRDDI